MRSRNHAEEGGLRLAPRTLVAAILPVLFPFLIVGASAATEHERCIVEQNFYFPKEGKEAAALEVRKRGSEIRRALGLPAGRILVLEQASSGHPARGEVVPRRTSYLMSLTEFVSEAEAEDARARLQASEEYLAVIREMADLIEHFETATWSPVWGGCASPTMTDRPDARSR